MEIQNPKQRKSWRTYTNTYQHLLSRCSHLRQGENGARIDKQTKQREQGKQNQKHTYQLPDLQQK